MGNNIMNLTSYQSSISSGKAELREIILTTLVKKSLEISDWMERVAHLNASEIILSEFNGDDVIDSYFLVIKDNNKEEEVVTISNGATNYLGKTAFRRIFEDKELLKNLISISYTDEARKENSKRMERVNSYLNGTIEYEDMSIAEILKVIPNRLKIANIDRLGYVIYNIKNERTTPFRISCTNEEMELIEGDNYDFSKENQMTLMLSRKKTFELHRREEGNFILLETVPKEIVSNGKKLTEREQSELYLDTLTAITLVQLRITGKDEELKDILETITSSLPRKRRKASMLQDVFKI